LRETLREDAAATIDGLRTAGAGIEILSGDSRARVAALAGRLGITQFEGRVGPEQKLARLAHCVRRRNVAVVGDGVNDALLWPARPGRGRRRRR
jgi:Cu2+-exporting ATPase